MDISFGHTRDDGCFCEVCCELGLPSVWGDRDRCARDKNSGLWFYRDEETHEIIEVRSTSSDLFGKGDLDHSFQETKTGSSLRWWGSRD